MFNSPTSPNPLRGLQHLARRSIWFWLLCNAPHALALSAAEARTTFERTHDAIYQIRVMDTAANNKTSTGTGFVVSSNGLVATNYHVVSSVVNTPDKYRIELLQEDETTVHLATVVNIDVVNDLSLIHI